MVAWPLSATVLWWHLGATITLKHNTKTFYNIYANAIQHNATHEICNAHSSRTTNRIYFTYGLRLAWNRSRCWDEFDVRRTSWQSDKWLHGSRRHPVMHCASVVTVWRADLVATWTPRHRLDDHCRTGTHCLKTSVMRRNEQSGLQFQGLPKTHIIMAARQL